MGILYDWWACETWRCCVNKRCSTPSISRHRQQHVHIFIRYTLCMPHTHTHTHTHTYSTCAVYTQETPTQTFKSIRSQMQHTHIHLLLYSTVLRCNCVAASILLHMWENKAPRGKSCPTEREGIDFSTCSYIVSAARGLGHLYGTDSPERINPVGFLSASELFLLFQDRNECCAVHQCLRGELWYFSMFLCFGV